jgi:hypothetical protein
LGPEALDGFRAIGASNWADILVEAMKHFGTPYPRVRDDRRQFLPKGCTTPRKEWDPFKHLDARFYEWAHNWEDAANNYAGRFITNGSG